MTRRMMRYVIPAGETEIELHIRTQSFTRHIFESSEHNIYLYIEEDDNEEPEQAIFKLFETGEAVAGAYMGTIGDGRAVKHLYWVNAYEGEEDERGNVRSTSDVPEVQAAGSGEHSTGASGSSEDV